MVEMNKEALSIIVIAVVLLAVFGGGCITSNIQNNTMQNNTTQNSTSTKSVSRTVEGTVHPPDSSVPYAYGNVYFSDYYGTHNKVVEMFGVSQYPTCHLCKYKSAEITLYQSSGSPDVWVAPYLIYYAKISTPPYYERVGQDVAVYSLIGDKPIQYGDLGWVHMPNGDVKYVYIQNFIPNNAHWIVYGAQVYYNNRIQQLYPDMQLVVWN
ncbi:MAG: hypothetical protein WCE81_02060 [Halobacteriota archaeon]